MARIGIKRGKVKQIIKQGTDKNGIDFVIYRCVESYKSGGTWKYNNFSCYTSGDDVKKITLEAMVQITGNMLESSNKVGDKTYHNFTIFTDTKKTEEDKDGVVLLDMPSDPLQKSIMQPTNVSDAEELPFD